MIAKFKWPIKYAVQHSQFVEFNVFGTFATSDEKLIEELKANPRVELVGEYESEKDLIMSSDDMSQAELAAVKEQNVANGGDKAPTIKELRQTYQAKHEKKADGNWDAKRLQEEIDKPVEPKE